METQTFKEEKEQLRNIIVNNAYFREKIILSSGKESDYYIDARLITLTPAGVTLTAKLMLDMVKDEKIDAIGGPTLGADPMIGALSVLSLQQNNPLNTFIIRKSAKAHGKGKQIEGPVLKAGSKVVLVDDVATTGKAFLQSLDVLNAMDIEAVKCVCIVDRDEGAKEAVEQKGSTLLSIFKASDIHQS
jgi:orotate phosphoribosyltransferase